MEIIFNQKTRLEIETQKTECEHHMASQPLLLLQQDNVLTGTQ